MKKRIVSLLLSALMLTVFPVTQSVTSFAAGKPEFVCSSSSGSSGETVDVTVSLKENPGISSYKFTLSYDESILELIDFDSDSDFDPILSGAMGVTNISEDLTYNPIVAVAASAEIQTDTGDILKLTFKIKDGLTDATAKLTLTLVEAKEYGVGDIEGTVTPGYITVGEGGQIGAGRGDIDGNGSITGNDAVAFLRNDVGLDADYVEANADVDNSGTINGNDVVYLLRALADFATEKADLGL